MVNLIAFLILLGSLAGIAAIILRKMPALAQMPENSDHRFDIADAAKKWTKARIEKIPGLDNFSSDVFLQKVLSRVRVMTLKLEAKTGNYLQKLREQSQRKRDEEQNDNYWSDLKNLIKTKEYLKRRTTIGIVKHAEEGSPETKVEFHPVVEKVTEIATKPKSDKRNRKKKTIMMF